MAHKLDFVPGAILEILPADPIKATKLTGWVLDPLIAYTDKNNVGFGSGLVLKAGTSCKVVSPPRKVNGVNLVQVDAGGTIGWVYYAPLKIRSKRI